MRTKKINFGKNNLKLEPQLTTATKKILLLRGSRRGALGLHKRECRSACSYCTLLLLSFSRILDYIFGCVEKSLPRLTKRVRGSVLMENICFPWFFLSRNDFCSGLYYTILPLPQLSWPYITALTKQLRALKMHTNTTERDSEHVRKSLEIHILLLRREHKENRFDGKL